MKKLCIGAIAVISIIWGPAQAADMPAKAPLYKAAPPILAWTGCYIGGNVGGGWAHTSYQINDPRVAPFDRADLGSNNGSAAVGGGQIGCDYQVGNWVFGAQGLFDGTAIKGSHRDPLNAFPLDWTSKISWLTTATARVGYVVSPQTLVYAKGGAAWANVHDDRSGPGFVPGTIFSQTTPDRTASGWTVGGGLEYLIAPNWSVFAEYNYIDFGTTRPTFIRSTDQATLFVDVRRQVQTVWVGLNFRFGGLGSAK
jgi:outer membrane immunogenic protein